MKHSTFDSFILIALCGGTFLGCSTAVQMTSSWNNNAVVIDGSSADWRTSLKPLANPPVAIGVCNDGEFLYVCLSTQNAFVQAQILNRGLTVWFDPQGGEEETFGIRFPIPGENTPRWNPRDPLAENFRFLEPSFRELEILGSGERQELFSILELKGIQIKMGASESGLVYEIKVPLRTSAQFRHAVGVTENQIVGIGFQTPEFRSERLQAPSGRASAGTRGSGRRGGRGSAGEVASAGSPDRPESLDLWTSVVLSSQR